MLFLSFRPSQPVSKSADSLIRPIYQFKNQPTGCTEVVVYCSGVARSLKSPNDKVPLRRKTKNVKLDAKHHRTKSALDALCVLPCCVRHV